MKANPSISAVRTIGRSASFWVAAAVLAHTLWTSAAPSMTYRLYASQWSLTPAVTTAMFAVFPIVVVSMLISFGDVSDYIGRRATMLVGLSCSLLGTACFAIAPSVLWIFVGRVFIGIGVGLSASPATAAMLEFSAAGQSRRASSIATLAQATGLASATVVGGALIQYAPYPTHLNYWVLLIVLVILSGATWFLPRQQASDPVGSWRPKVPNIPKGFRGIFATSAIATISGYAIGGLLMAVGAQIAHDLIRSDNALVNGIAIALFAIAAGAVAIPGKQLTPTTAITVGGVSSVIGMALLAQSTTRHALPLFVAAATAGGIGFSLMYQGGLSLINANAPADRRGGVLSALYLAAFAMQALIVSLLGVAATAWGLAVAVDLGAIAIALLSVSAICLAISIGRRSPRHLVLRKGSVSVTMGD